MIRQILELKEGLLISLKAIKANKGRAILTTLGIVIGICSVALMSTAINGIDTAFKKGISALGANNLYIDKWAWFEDSEYWKLRNRKNINLEHYDKFKKIAKLPYAIAPMIITVEKLACNKKYVEDVLVTGSNSEYINTTNFDFSKGRFFTELESKGGRNVVVLGYDVANHLFESKNPQNKYIKIAGIRFKVVGALKKQGSNMLGNFNPDKKVFIPIKCVFKYYASKYSRSIVIVVRAQSSDLIDKTRDEAIGVMRRVRGLLYNEKNDFTVNQQEGLTEIYNQQVGVIKIVGFFITGLSLLVGAIGIMNIMFVSVKERTKEIGIRKAIGAKKRAILGQFLFESAFICLIGGLIGLLLAILLSFAINKILPTTIQVETVIMAIIISLITGMISGFAPAYSGAKMDPVTALRYE